MLSILISFFFWYTLPPSKNFHSRTLEVGKLVKSMLSHLKDRGLRYLYCFGFLLAGSFVTLFNYISYQLTAPPYSLSQAVVSWIFIVYIAGTFSSTWMGRLADKYGLRKVLWVAILIQLTGAVITLNSNLLLKIIGVAVFTFGYFACFTIASSWVGSLASHDKAQATSLFLFLFYIGSSIGGTAGGRFWTEFGWGGVISMISSLLVLGLILSIRLSVITARSSTKQQKIHT
jgi:YNFM family putative membrane transporter